MDHPEICGKHEVSDARTWTKDGLDQQTQLGITCDVTDLISNWTLVTKNWRTRQAHREAEF